MMMTNAFSALQQLHSIIKNGEEFGISKTKPFVINTIGNAYIIHQENMTGTSLRKIIQ